MVAREWDCSDTKGLCRLKLDMTQIIDGYAGNEHALTAVPLMRTW